jgi:hypothetical protein
VATRPLSGRCCSIRPGSGCSPSLSIYQEGGFRALSALTTLPIVIAMLVLAGAKWLAGVDAGEEVQR